LPDDHFSDALALLEKRCELDAALDPETALSMLSQRYSYVFPSMSVLAMLSELGPLVEMGAGTGYWAYKLRSMGVDIVAFDQAPPDGERVNRYHAKTETWTQVLRGDQTVLSGYSNRALFLCWPPLFSALGECLSYYGGDTVAYIGDDGYRTVRLDHLRDTFTQATEATPVRALEPYPGGPAMLSIWKRVR
jgi:hypothetical protein